MISARGGARTVRRPWLGARLQTLEGDIAASLGLDRASGVLVHSVYDKGPAADAGLKRGDVILFLDDQVVENPEAFGYRLTLKGIEGHMNLTVWRDRQRITLDVKLVPPPETRPREPLRIRARTPFAGATIVNTSPAVADELQLDLPPDGIVVSDLEDGSVAARVGFQKGDQILAINGQKVVSTKDAERLFRNVGQYWEITINRGGRMFTTVLGG